MRKPSFRVMGVAFVAAVVLVISVVAFMRNANMKTESMSSTLPDFYSQNVQPIFTQRCVACHSCNIAPCQLNLTSYDGVTRGGIKALLYDPGRKAAATPTRFGVDAKTTDGWRKIGFYDVLTPMNQTPMDSILLPLIKLRQEHADLRPALKVEDSHTCPGNKAEVADFVKAHADSGMPYGLPPLQKAESDIIEAWLAKGAPGPTQTNEHVPASFVPVQDYLNDQSPKAQLVARYLYEHLFLAHIHLEGSPHPRFFRLIRSSTECSSGPNEVATRRPWDSTGDAKFWYCFEPINQVIVDKSHLVYEVGAKKLARWKELFDTGSWSVQHPPARDDSSASNPFVTFQDIPAKARYQWLLDDAQYTVMTFIKGPVCRGQTALNVINEQFYVMFLDPKADHFVNDAAYAAQAAPFLRLPAETGSSMPLGLGSYDHAVDVLAPLRNQYRELRDAKFRSERPNGYSLEDIWDGERTNDNALLTVIRHYDSAQVLKGAIGNIPKTSFVLDYPLFERIVYDLVVGYDVFGATSHQLDTREYMSLIRAEAEENYLNFLPIAVRKPLRDFWYRGMSVKAVKARIKNIGMFTFGEMHPTAVPFEGDFSKGADPQVQFSAKKQFMDALYASRYSSKVRGVADVFNTPKAPAMSTTPKTIRTIEEFEAHLAKIAMKTSNGNNFVKYMDDATLVRVNIAPGQDRVYTIIRNREHSNVALALTENHYRLKDEDVIIVSKGIIASYPNRFLNVSLQTSGQFIYDLINLHDPASYAAYLNAYGVNKENPNFWAKTDWIQKFYLDADPVYNGILDLSRYGAAEADDRL